MPTTIATFVQTTSWSHASQLGALALQMKWANVGVGKLHRPYRLRLFLLDAAGQAACTADAKADPRDWLPGEHILTESLPLPAALKSGDYILAVALVDPSGRQRPFRLAIDVREEEGRYCLSKIRVE